MSEAKSAMLENAPMKTLSFKPQPTSPISFIPIDTSIGFSHLYSPRTSSTSGNCKAHSSTPCIEVKVVASIMASLLPILLPFSSASLFASPSFAASLLSLFQTMAQSMPSIKLYFLTISFNALFSSMNAFTTSSFDTCFPLCFTLSIRCSPIIFPSSSTRSDPPTKFRKYKAANEVSPKRFFKHIFVASLPTLFPNSRFVMNSIFVVFSSILVNLMTSRSDASLMVPSLLNSLLSLWLCLCIEDFLVILGSPTMR
mmetsp:Transcript_8778/g.17780  ORF Transcript_8778/g.17780 Transcript_8778/m.17780 type:complete len:255 (+) Transcript_8778:1398-2162(+)